MSGVDWTRCFQGTQMSDVDLSTYYDNGQAVGDWRETLIKQIEEGLAVLEDALANQCFKQDDYSIYTGTSGIALLYLHLADKLYLNTPSRRKAALARALDLITVPLTKLNGRRLTFLCGDGGVLALAAVLYTYHDNTAVAGHCAQGLQTLSELALTDRVMPSELLYGTAGYLHALLFAKHYLPHSINDTVIQRVVQQILAKGRQGAKQCPSAVLQYQWHDKHYLGAAHGLSGILYTLLLTDLSHDELHTFVIPSVQYLLSQRFPSHNLRSSLGSQTDRLVQWCHGSPGFVSLLTHLHRTSGGSFLQEALKSATPIWKRGLLRKGHGLCHGTAGNAYAFLDLYQATDDPSWLNKAVQYAQWSVSQKDVSKSQDKSMSLFDGLAGMLYFYCDMLEPKRAAFPGFQLPK